jgi:hypothetical protein
LRREFDEQEDKNPAAKKMSATMQPKHQRNPVERTG